MSVVPDFLRHRPLWGDLTPLVVPWVVVWSDEQHAFVTRIIRWHGHPAIYTDRQSGVPNFGGTNSHRQRRCMEEGRCQVCGEKGATVYVIIDDRATSKTHVGLWNEGRWIINAPLHEQCYEYSRSVCPHLRSTEPYAIVRSERPLRLVGYSDGIMAWPLNMHPPGRYAAREAIVAAPGDE